MLKLKNYLIAFLVFLAVYQTSTLWFEDFSNHSFFYYLKNNIKMANIQEAFEKNIESITISTENNKYLNQYSNISNIEYKKVFDEAISTIIKKGKYTYQDDFDIKYILDNKSVLYNYSYNINSSDLEKIFGIKYKKFPKNIIFNTIALVPVLKDSSNIKAIFYQSDKNTAHIFTFSSQSLAENIYYTLDNFSNFETKDFYSISSLNSGIDLFSKNQFIPKAKNNQAYVNNIKAVNPLEQDGGILLSGIEKYIDIFFYNQAIKWNSSLDETYTFKDDNTVIKYYTNGVLEYVNYKSSLSKEVPPYKIALNFLKKDTNIKNEYYLKDYKNTPEGTTFYFDYKINNFPIILSDDIKQKTNMQSIIEITISENKVSRYKKIVYNFYTSETLKLWNVEFLNALDKIFLKRISQNLENNDVSSINLCYNFGLDLKNISLVWKIKIKDDIYYEDIESM